MGPDVTCWNCESAAPRRRVDVESILHGRPRAEGGPYRAWRCPVCRTDNGVLAGPSGGVLLYPLSGLRPPGLLDRFLSAAESLRLAKSRAWWAEHRDRVERFRLGAPDPVPPRPRATRPGPGSSRPAAASSGPRAVLGVGPSATADDVRRAFRRLAKRHHPDRAGADPAAAERFREIRAAYEALLREAEG